MKAQRIDVYKITHTHTMRRQSEKEGKEKRQTENQLTTHYNKISLACC